MPKSPMWSLLIICRGTRQWSDNLAVGTEQEKGARIFSPSVSVYCIFEGKEQSTAGAWGKSSHTWRDPGVGYSPRNTGLLLSGIHLKEVKTQLERNIDILQRCWRHCLWCSGFISLWSVGLLLLPQQHNTIFPIISSHSSHSIQIFSTLRKIRSEWIM